MHMDQRFLAKVDPIIRDNYSWEAFMLIIEYFRDKERKKLDAILSPEDLMRINGNIHLLKQMASFRDHAMSAMEVLRDAKQSSGNAV